MPKTKMTKTKVKAVDVFRCMVENGYQIVPTDSLPGRSQEKRNPRLRISRSFSHAVAESCGGRPDHVLAGMHGRSVVLSGYSPAKRQNVQVFLQTGGVMTETALAALREKTGLDL